MRIPRFQVAGLLRNGGAVLLAFVTACGHGKSTPPVPTVALVQMPAGSGYESATAQARAGLLECARQSRVHVAVSQTGDAERQATLFATEDVDTTIGIGPMAAAGIAQTARRFDARHFVSIGAVVAQPNVESILFDVAQGAYLAGTLAAAATKTGRVALLAADPLDAGQKMGVAFRRGTAAIRPALTVRSVYLPSLDDASAAQLAAKRLFADRFDVVYVAAGPAGSGAVEAARAFKNRFIIGSQLEEASLGRAPVLASVDYRVDAAALRACLETVAQKPQSGTVELGAAEGGVMLATFALARSVVGPQALIRVGLAERALGGAGPLP